MYICVYLRVYIYMNIYIYIYTYVKVHMPHARTVACACAALASSSAFVSAPASASSLRFSEEASVASRALTSDRPSDSFAICASWASCFWRSAAPACSVADSARLASSPTPSASDALFVVLNVRSTT